MDETRKAKRTAWQPLTFSGVAAFAETALKRLLLVQFIFAVLVAASVVWFFSAAWFPTIEETIRQLPETGEIRNGKLAWPDETPRLLAEGRFLSFAADWDHTGVIRSPAHIQVELGRNGVRFISIFGYADCSYPFDDRVIAINRTEMEPRWGAWAPPILWITFGSVVIWLLANWALLASVVCLPIWLLGFFANRQLSLAGSWKLAGAALMPGALLMMAAILFYGLDVLDLVQLLAAALAHLAIDLVYMAGSLFFAPRLPFCSKGGNPFAFLASGTENDKKPKE
jgi:hypothetical protein